MGQIEKDQDKKPLSKGEDRVETLIAMNYHSHLIGNILVTDLESNYKFAGESCAEN